MGDTVDKIIQQWRHERPELDLAPMAVTARLTRLAALLERGVDDTLAAQGLASWEFEVLASLRRNGSPFVLSVGRLQATMMISSGTMTHRLDRLEKRGLVARSKDLNDRRGIQVSLTPDGRTLIDNVIEARLARERDLLTTLDKDQQTNLASLLRGLLTAMEQ
ncbi:MarR family winged helix-turn-helix transcriptional regulator [Kibdelosporangium aridum]|uniref:DNA-binding transcriptional regulator, MarR family n=1 Tax=Kibdelosporangium aridum TaxID=2030 RepID=A0A1Y5XL12_KIBAR|nr:MarR family transcriptional regulator [Kibdelosporangium aridum]SMC97957.1 DNA-binding transcriptional regulator, MarR family [Kibdelosporangium aridum]